MNKFRPAPDKIFLLVGMAVFFNLTFVMSFLSPYPLALLLLLHGRKKGYAAIICAVLLTYALAPFLGPYYLILPSMLMSSFLASLIAEFTLRKAHPVRSFLLSGSLLSLLLLGLFWHFQRNHYLEAELITLIKNSSADLTKNSAKFIEEQGEEAREFLDLLKNPQSFATELIKSLPFNIVMGCFFVVWLNLLLLLRSLRPYAQMIFFPFSERELIRFKVPYPFVWGVIFFLAVATFGDQLDQAHLAGIDIIFWSKKILMLLGTFYLFQGFGILLEFMTNLRIVGLLRTFFVVITLIFGYWLLAILGLFDTFVDFRRFFARKNH